MSDTPILDTLPGNPMRQSATLGHLLSNLNFFVQARHKIQPNWFRDRKHGKIYQFFINMTDEAGVVPRPAELKQWREFDPLDNAERMALGTAIDKALNDSQLIRLEMIKPELTTWLCSKILQEAIVVATKHWNQNKFTDAAQILETAAKGFREARFEEGTALSFLEPKTWIAAMEDAGADALTTGLTLLDRGLLDLSPKQAREKRNAEEKGLTPPTEPGGLKLGDTTVILAASNVGKCLGRGTPVILHSGHVVPVETVRVKDRLMGPDGLPRTVLSVTRGVGPLYRITPRNGGDAFVCNDVHVLSLKAVKDLRSSKNYVRKDGSSFSGNYCSELKGSITNIPLNEYLKKTRDWKTKHKLWRAALEFSKKDLPIEPYILGLWLGDGHSDRAGFTTMDVELKEEWEKWVKSNGDRLVVQGKGRNNKALTYVACLREGVSQGTRVSGTNIVSCKRLNDIGVLKNKHIPMEYLTASVEQRLQLLAGLVDTDGYVQTLQGESPHIEIIQKNQRLMNEIAFLARSLGYKVNVSECRKGCQTGAVGTYYRANISGELSKIPTLLARKQPRDSKKASSTSGFDVEFLGDGEYLGFELDGDHLFLLGDFTVTHNTTTMITVAAHNIVRGKNVLFMTHESRGEDIRFQILQSILEKTPNEIFDMYRTKEGMDILNAATAGINARMVYVPYNKAGMTVESVVSIVRRHQEDRAAQNGTGFDLMVSDYPAKLTTERASKGNMNERHIQTLVYDYYVQLALEYNFHALLAAQTNREGSKVNSGAYDNKNGTEHRLLTGEDVAEAFGIYQIATNMITLNRSPTAKQAGRMTFYVTKSRSSATGLAVVARTNFPARRTHSNEMGATAYYGTKTMEKSIDGLLQAYNGRLVDTAHLVNAE